MADSNFIFSSSPIELKKVGEDYFVEGYISTSDLDLVNDIVTKDCMVDMAEQMKARTIKLDVEHESFRGNNEVELEINKTIIPVAKIDDFLVDKKGLKITAKLNKHVKRFNEVKNSIRDGFLDAYSIAFVPVESRIEEREGQEVRLLDKVNLFNVAFTGNPVNIHTTMTNVFAKSLEYLKDHETESKLKALSEKAYEKDGAHAHTEDEPLGLHNHPEIENRISSVYDTIYRIQKESEPETMKAIESKRKHSAKWHRLVNKLKKTGKVRSPEAVATEILGEGSYKSYDHESENIKSNKKEVEKMSEKDSEKETKEEDKEEEKEETEEKTSESEEKAKKKPKDEEEEEEEKKKKAKKKVSKKDEDESKESKEESKEESDEESEESKESESEEPETKSKLEKLNKDMMEVKAALKKPLLKSKVEQTNKELKNVEEKALNPLDVIA